jgi:hypothetical protein
MPAKPTALVPLAGGSEELARGARRAALVTGRGPGAALEFALALVELLCGAEKAAEVAAPLLLPSAPGSPG